MKKLWICVCLLLVVAGCGDGRQQLSPQAADLVRRIDEANLAAGRFLADNQSPDGAWRSSIYGLYKDGPSLSPHVVTCLFFLPRTQQQQLAFEKGLAYLEMVMDESGNLRNGKDLLYPVYTCGEISRMIAKGPRTPKRLALQASLLKYIRGFQMNETLGWQEDDLEYGGWSFAPQPPRKPAPGRPGGKWDWPNLSSTLYGVGAMRSAKIPQTDPSFRQALIFVQRCQNFGQGPDADPKFDDGGFFFTPVEAIQNKAGIAGTDAQGRQRFYSYGSMTVDGLRALLSSGLPQDHPRVLAARRWLERNYSVEHNPGTFAEAQEGVRDAFYYYYCWGVAHAFMHLKVRQISTPNGQVDWATDLAEALLRRQRPDGSWASRYLEAKEDDPLVATPFAASALAICRSVITGNSSLSPHAPGGR